MIQNVLRSTARQVRGYATAPKPQSNLPLYMGLAGVAGLAGYVYLQRSEAPAALNAPIAPSSALSKDEWRPFKLSKVEPYNHNTKVYHFSFDQDKISGGQVASCLLVKTPEGDGQVLDNKGKPVIRPYTPISSPDARGEVKLMIKEYKDGALTPYISNLAVGQELLFKGPNPKYKYAPGAFDRGLCVAGGSGITPMYQLISHALANPDDKTKWTLVFSNVSENDILLREEWDALAKDERLTVHYALDQANRDWKGETGYISKGLVEKVFPKGDDKVKAFVCGPPGQVAALAGPKDGFKQGEIKGILADLGYGQEEVYKF